MSSDKDKAVTKDQFVETYFLLGFPKGVKGSEKYLEKLFDKFVAPMQQENQRLKAENTRLMSEMEEEQNQFAEERDLEASLRQMTEERDRLKADIFKFAHWIVWNAWIEFTGDSEGGEYYSKRVGVGPLRREKKTIQELYEMYRATLTASTDGEK